jgi:hypothetical protein
MKQYSEYTIEYVNDICKVLNDSGVLMDSSTKQSFEPENLETLTIFLQSYVVSRIDIFTLLNDRGLVNRGRCPYTGQRIDSTFPKWTYANTRSVFVSQEGFLLMQKEADEDFEKVMGRPAPKRIQPPQEKSSGCYIATVCYGNEFAPEVLSLKKFRDVRLSKSSFGRLFIKFYYLLSPKIAKKLEGKTTINNFIRKYFLDVIVRNIRK